MPFIGDAGGLGKGVEEAGVVGDLVEPAPGSQLGVLTERTHAVAESGPGQNGDVPHQQQGPGRKGCLLYTSPSPRDQRGSRMPSSA